MDKIKNISPLRYPGGKTRACKILDRVMCENFNMTTFNTIRSPFFGGGSFEFFVQNKYNLYIVANDKFYPLYNFWFMCQKKKSELCSALNSKLGTIEKNEFCYFREKIMQETNSLEQAIMYFVINRCSFSGATLSGGFSYESSKKRFTKSSIEKIRKLNLLKFEICNVDFEPFIKDTKPEDFLFLDPPYYLEKSSKLYGNNGDMHENFSHEKLFDCISLRKNWLMTYNNCEYIRNLYKNFKIIEVSWSYGMNSSKNSSEIIIISHR